MKLRDLFAMATGSFEPASASAMLTAAIVTLVFTATAWLLRGVTKSGAVAGAIVSFVMYASAGPGAFAALVSVFVIAVATTRIGYARKQALGAAEDREGRRASQILANLGIAALATAWFAISQQHSLLIAAAAALAEAAADTASSEIGEASSGQARLITTFETVPAGTDGGVTAWGTVAGIIASFLIAACCIFVRLIPRFAFFLVAAAGVLGMLLDSILGAVLERRRVLNNDTVNLLGTLFAALIALLLARMMLVSVGLQLIL